MLPNHIVNCSAAASESYSRRQYITSRNRTVSAARRGAREEHSYLLPLREAVAGAVRGRTDHTQLAAAAS